jgi:predicted transposase/invertase (TIGR01784 family)
VTFCSYTVFPNRAEYVNSFSMRHDEDNEQLTDAIRVIYLELSKLDEVLRKPVDTMTELEKWAVFFQYADSFKYRETVNKVIETKEALQMAGELLMSVSQDERERAIAISRKKFQTDLQSNLATAEDRGRAEGRAEGEFVKALAVARNLLGMNIPLDQIVIATGLTREEVENLSD